MTMFIILGYVLPAVVFFVLNCWDEIDCNDELTLGGVFFGLLGAIIPVTNWLALFSILNYINDKYNLITLNFVIYRRKK